MGPMRRGLMLREVWGSPPWFDYGDTGCRSAGCRLFAVSGRNS